MAEGRRLLRLFPADFRGDFGDDMAATFNDQRRDVLAAEAFPPPLGSSVPDINAVTRRRFCNRRAEPFYLTLCFYRGFVSSA